MITERWITDANGLVPSHIDKMLFENDIIIDYKRDRNKRVLSASKGIGKTLLLSSKRYEFEKEFGDEEQGKESAIFIPQDAPYIDSISRLVIPNKNTKNILEKIDTVISIWELAIKISALYHFSKRTSKFYSKEHIEKLFPNIEEVDEYTFLWLRGESLLPNVCPSFIFQHIIRLNIKSIRKMTDDYAHNISNLYLDIHSAVIIFIDTMDQMFIDTNVDLKKVWFNVQAGLLEATYNTYKSNSHVKVYIAIRQEVEAQHKTINGLAISSMVCLLKYSKNDLKRMINKLCVVYEECKTLEDYIGVDEIHNTYYGVDESVFDYIYRHTVGRPRDLTAILSEMPRYNKDSNRSKEDIINDVRNTTNSVSRIQIINNLFQEQQILLKALDTIEKRDEFFSIIDKNILDKYELIEVCRIFNGEVNCDHNCRAKCHLEHPFCDLYNLGLLGVVSENESGKTTQKFKKPDEISNFETGSFPLTSKYYFIHPALKQEIEFIKEQITDDTYETNKFILVGDGEEWFEHYDKIVELTKIIEGINNREQSELMIETIGDIQKVILKLLKKKEKNGLSVSDSLDVIRARIDDIDRFKNLQSISVVALPIFNDLVHYIETIITNYKS